MEHEEILLFGRERQVREVLERLRQTQFVAVLGGSGSGKSSLVLAGVVPELRSFGIPGAGDFWLPLVCTPGTNASSADLAQRLDTPITRLARRFATLLRSRGSPEQDEARVAEIATRLREELGFSTLVELYTDELAAPPGPDPKDAHILIVIDQFEELFHPTTRNGADTRLLVERVIDHFFSPHPRCYIVVTMRSEHLNDCAGYLELPDAINKASYLVRRLDDEELADAITLPAQRLLRLRQIAEDDGARLPESVEFDAAVVARLLRDARAISDDPDHLPLLQHALARTWEAATARVADRLDLPELILPGDLAVAVGTAAAGQAQVLEESVNVLTASLENWAEAAYQHLGEQDRGRLDGLLRRLAVKDPNTGMYSQQRVRVDEGARLLGPDKTRDDLKALLADGFIGDVEYLYWDDNDPQRTTLKVSHESFIRGWKHFRSLIDAEADRFAEFVELLRKCEARKRGGQSADLLLERGDLRRAEAAGMPAVLASRDDRAEWFRRLGATRAYAGLGALGDTDGGGTDGDVDRFLALSVARQRALVADKGRRQRVRRLLWFAGGVVVPLLSYFALVQVPASSRSEFLVLAAQQAQGEPTQQSAGVGKSEDVLRRLVEAAQQIERGRQGDSLTQELNRWVLDQFAELPLLRRRAGFVQNVAAVTEPVVNDRLRSTLQSSIWHAANSQARAVKHHQAVEGVAATCTGDDPDQKDLSGTLFTYQDEVNPSLSRRLFLVRSPVDEEFERLDLYEARSTKGAAKEGLGPDEVQERQAEMNCSVKGNLFGQGGWIVNGQSRTDIAFDARLRFMFLAEGSGDEPLVTIHEIRPQDDGRTGERRLVLEFRLELTEETDVRHFRSVLRPDSQTTPRQVVDTLRMEAGWAFVIGDQTWRLVVPSGEFLDPKEEVNFAALELVSDRLSDCGRLGEQVRRSWIGFAKKTAFYYDPNSESHCYLAVRTNAGHSAFDDIEVGVYARPSKATLDNAKDLLPAPLAWLPKFTRVRGDKDEFTLHIGKGERDGWLAVRAKTSQGEQRLRAGPWSTCALARLAAQVLPPSGSQAPDSAGLKDPCGIAGVLPTDLASAGAR